MPYSSEIERSLTIIPFALGYHDIWGNFYQPTEEALRAALRALRFHPDDTQRFRGELDELELHFRSLPGTVVLHGEERQLPLHGIESGTRWELRHEYGGSSAGVLEHGLVLLPRSLATGYHDLLIGAHRIRLILCPQSAFPPPEKAWGLSVQLYSLFSDRSEGVGDFQDARELCEFVYETGGTFVGLNPLHLLFPGDPLGYSPYSPSSRRALNPLYLRVQDIPEFCSSAAVRRDLPTVDPATLIDYQTVAREKYQLFQQCFDALSGERREEFERFKRSADSHLQNCALHAALDSLFRGKEPTLCGWQTWPAELQTPERARQSELYSKLKEQEEFQLYLQWETLRQLREVEGRLPLGLYLDLAVGVSPSGAEVWEDPELFALGVSAGAPPDLLNVQGQVWGLAPYIPWELRRREFAPFIETLRFQMAHAGAIRIDHIIGLQRSYWVPEGFSGRDGLYMNYPMRDLIGIVALESQRNQCVVIGEDLGTVPPEIQAEMKARSLLSYKVLYFMKHYESDESFKSQEQYPKDSLVTASTHDLPTLVGFCQARDLDVRKPLGLFSESITYENELEGRKLDIQRLAELLLLEENPTSIEALVSSILNFLAGTPSMLMAVQLEDLLGMVDQMNLPGTVTEHPNWKQRVAQSVQQIVGNEQLRQQLCRLSNLRRESV